MITYKYLKQNLCVITDPEPMQVEKDLRLRFENIEGLSAPITAKLVSDGVYFSAVVNGECIFPRAALVGNIAIRLIASEGTILCTGFRAVETKDGGLWLYPDLAEVFGRLAAVETDISRLIEKNNTLAEKIKTLEDKLAKLFSGYNY